MRILLSFFGTLELDQGTFISWSNILVDGLVDGGLKKFYNGWSDYLPGYLYVLWILGKINIFGGFFQTLIYKLPAIIADILTGILIYKIISKSKDTRWGLIGAALYVFNPAIIANSTLWGQVDSLTSLFSMLAVYLLPFNILYFSAVSLAIGTLIKPQAAFIFPVIILLFLKEKRKFTDLISYSLIGLTTFVLGFVPFWNHSNLFSFIVERLGISASQYPYTSVNAFNFFGIFGFWKMDNNWFQFGGYLFVILLTILLFKKLLKIKNPEYILMSFIFAATFCFFTRMHERHLLPVFAPLAILLIENPIFLIPYLGFTITYILNLYYAFIWINQDFREIFSDFFLKFFSLLNTVFTGFIFYAIVFKIKLNFKKIKENLIKIKINKNKPVNYKFAKINLSPNKNKLIICLILTFAFISRIFNLGGIKEMYFDEVYHAFTAKVMMGTEAPKAWEWWNTPPEGFAYEWTHPPLSKLGMVLGMKVFGQNSFGYRVPGAILGTAAIYLIYILSKKLFKDEVVGIISAAVFSLDGLPLVLSRIGMNDSYLLFFSLLSIIFFLKRNDTLSAISFGLAISSKWSAIWVAPILFVIWLRRNPLKLTLKEMLITAFSFAVFPITIYLLTYTPMFLTGHNITTWWGMQQQMWWYHTGLRATHPYTSLWWTWPLDIRPIYLYTSNEINGWVARIYAMGNPFVFWFGLSSIFYCGIISWLEKNKTLALVVFSYLIFFVPWAASPRIMFIYHYLPSIPFLAIATGYVLRRNPKLIFAYLFICLFVYLYFYPHWAGLNIPLWLDQSYYWLTSWR